MNRAFTEHTLSWSVLSVKGYEGEKTQCLLSSSSLSQGVRNRCYVYEERKWMKICANAIWNHGSADQWPFILCILLSKNGNNDISEGSVLIKWDRHKEYSTTCGRW